MNKLNRVRISKLKFENFKCFKNIELELGRLTLLTGANSSGKSSIIYGILGSLQSGEFPFQFSPNGKYIEMGDFQEISNKHDINNTIIISYTIESIVTYNIKTEWKIDKVNKLPFLNNLEVKTNYFTLTIQKQKKYNLNFEYYADKNPIKEFYESNLAKLVFEITKKIFVFNENKQNSMMNDKYLDKLDIDKVTKELLGKDLKIEFEFNELTEIKNPSNGNFMLQQTINELEYIFSELDKNTNYISSFRLHPDRTYYEQTKTDLKVGKFGERYTDQIVLWETKKSKKYKELINKLNDIKLLNDIKTKRLEGGRYELLVKPQENGQMCSLADVGFGISQFLPILVADFQLGDNSFLYVSQPEIHLHPSVQANFTDYIINQINSTNKSYIIETHSEYLINRLRLGIVKEEIKEDNIKTYFFRNNGETVENFPLYLTKDGQIKNAPEDFFKTYMIDVMDIAINSAK